MDFEKIKKQFMLENGFAKKTSLSDDDYNKLTDEEKQGFIKAENEWDGYYKTEYIDVTEHELTQLALFAINNKVIKIENFVKRGFWGFVALWVIMSLFGIRVRVY